MAMAYYPNYQMYSYPFSGQYTPQQGYAYAHGDPDPWRQARSALIHHTHMQKATESKPRLAKEEVELLEAEFQKNHKPNSSLKKALAEQMRVEVARINNWFQNRRAKAKHEARQALEQIKSESTSPNQDSNADETKPQLPVPSINVSTHSTANDAASTPSEDAKSPFDVSQPEETSAYSSPKTMTFQHNEQQFVMDSPEASYYAHSSCDFPTMTAGSSPEVSTSHLSIPLSVDIAATLQEAAAGLTAFAPYGVLPGHDQLDRPVATFPSQLLPSDASSVEMELEAQNCRESCEDMTPYQSYSPESVHSPPPMSPDSLKNSTPVTLDIASRRNMRRPAPLALRSYSFAPGGPKTGLELPKRSEAASPMRRIASATGMSFAGRISKPVSTAPRSPMFLDKRQEAILQLARSPIMGAPGQHAAPPTPNTPVVGNQQSLRESTVSSMSSEDEHKGYTFQQRGPFAMDPSIRTPPATPSIGANFPEGVFAGYGMSDEPLNTPLMGTFGTEPEFPPLQAGVPGYITGGCVSQPSTPGFTPAAMGPAYFAVFPGSNQEYNWSDGMSASAKSSPGQQARSRQLTFSNVTPQDFQR